MQKPQLCGRSESKSTPQGLVGCLCQYPAVINERFFEISQTGADSGAMAQMPIASLSAGLVYLERQTAPPSHKTLRQNNLPQRLDKRGIFWYNKWTLGWNLVLEAKCCKWNNKRTLRKLQSNLIFIEVWRNWGRCRRAAGGGWSEA